MTIIKGIKVGTTEITSAYSDGNNRSDTKELEVIAVSLQAVNGVISSPSNTVYTGFAITPTPAVTVTLDGVVTTLQLGTDYTLSYANNINVGTATVTATGIGNYSGTISSTWTITGALFQGAEHNPRLRHCQGVQEVPSQDLPCLCDRTESLYIHFVLRNGSGDRLRWWQRLGARH